MLARFYGWSPQVINKLNTQTFYEYLNAIGPLRSQESLLSMEIADYPNLKSDSRKKIHKKHSSESKKIVPSKTRTSEELEEFLKLKL